MPITVSYLTQLSPSTLAVINESSGQYGAPAGIWFLGGYVYLATGRYLYQFNPANLSAVFLYSGSSTVYFEDVTYNGTYLYATLSNNTLVKIDPTDMSIVSVSTGTTFSVIIYNGKNLIAALTNGDVAFVDQNTLDIISSVPVTTNSPKSMTVSSLRYGVSWAFKS